MDFEFTSRESTGIKPVWAQGQDNLNHNTKGLDNDMTISPNPPSIFSPPPSQPTFGQNQPIPFSFNTPQRSSSSSTSSAWAPPPNFSPSKAFPQPVPVSSPGVRDVDMPDASPRSPERPDEHNGALVLGGGTRRRVYKARGPLGKMSRTKSRVVVYEEEDSFGGGETDEDDGDNILSRPQDRKTKTENHYTLNMSTGLHPKSDLPYLLAGYLQFFFNLSLILVFLYLLVQFILTVQRDVEHRISEHSMEIVQEITQCASLYNLNQCSINPVPAMHRQCSIWETCMNRDPTKVGRAKVGAELIAEVVNGFVEPISWKTLAFTLTSLSFLTVFINTLLSLYRSKHNNTHPDPSLHPLHPHHPLSLPQPHAAYGSHMLGLSGPTSWKSMGEMGGHEGGGDGEEENVGGGPSRKRKLEGGTVNIR